MKLTNCLNCGNTLSNEALFCSSCGQKVINTSEKIKIETNNCPKCNRPFEKDEKFCVECGTPINEITQKNSDIQEQTQQSTISKSIQPPKKKKRSFFGCLGRILLFIITILIIGIVIIWNLPDDYFDESNGNTTNSIEIENKTNSDETSINSNKIENKKTLDINDDSAADKYRNGIDVEPDQYKAFELYEKLAKKGDLNAMVALADYYEQGIWVKKDSKKAIKLLQQATEKGSLAAKWQLEFLQSGK